MNIHLFAAAATIITLFIFGPLLLDILSRSRNNEAFIRGFRAGASYMADETETLPAEMIKGLDGWGRVDYEAAWDRHRASRTNKKD